jgi:murein DD-endopeptidase MepM/ murein hydrolase activator NlpD
MVLVIGVPIGGSRAARLVASPVLVDARAPSTCPRGTLPDEGTCVRATEGDDFVVGDAEPNAHHERSGRYVVYDQIPRRPDRPADYDAYRYPIPAGLPNGHHVISGYDLDKPDERQRRGAKMHAVGHGGVDLPQTKGSPISMIALDHQEGDARVVFVGSLFGNTVITLHTLHEATGPRDYVLVWGHLDAPAPGLEKGRVLREGETLGTVGDSGSPELVHLHLEARRVREGRDAMKLVGGEAILDASIVCDPRNVLPLR